MTDGQAPGVFLEGGAIAVPKNAPHKAGALKAIAAWLTAPVQTVWSGYIGDSSPNPKVVATDPVIKSVAADVASQKPDAPEPLLRVASAEARAVHHQHPRGLHGRPEQPR